jgi:predicted 2-oxoglutarate/Fe(II)-dependent dioxygenase YbiX
MAAININGLYAGKMTSDVTIAGCINIFENAWPQPQDTIKIIEDQCANPDSGVYWARAGTVGDGPHQSLRTNKTIPISELASVADNSALQAVHNQMYMMLLASTVPYAERYKIREPFFHEGYSILKYGPGEEYKFHYDSGTEMGRALSVLVYLNSEFEGGELEFPNFGIKIKPQPGMLVLFPSNFAYGHIARPVTSGTKYALVTWLRDRPINPSIRG